MTLVDDDRPAKKVQHEIGSDLSALSVDELRSRIALLGEEVSRIEREIASKSSSRSSAESLFKR
jgi:uncharacterized small protein (DUF1192 family)